MPRKKIRIMISSRCNDPFPAKGPPLSDLRKALKADLEAEELLGEQLFEVWINEDAPPADTSEDSLAVCLRSVDEADILLVLANGNAGWAGSGADVGICHAELMRGVGTAPGKVRLISLGEIADDPEDSAQASRNARFRKYLSSQNYFRGGSVRTRDQAIKRVKEATFDAVQSLVQLGVREARKGKYHIGEALSWSKLNYSARAAEMVSVLAQAFEGRESNSRRDGSFVSLPVAGQDILFSLHAVPSALTVSAGREMVGRPFLQDHAEITRLKAAAGPVHVIACQKGATEAQASGLLGFPDATIVAPPFGIYVADPLSHVQFVFLQHCRDPSMTRFAAQRLFDWLEQSGEDRLMAKRAASRTRIVQAIAKEQ